MPRGRHRRGIGNSSAGEGATYGFYMRIWLSFSNERGTFEVTGGRTMPKFAWTMADFAGIAMPGPVAPIAFNSKGH